MSRSNSSKTIQQPFENTQETLETPDLAAFRSFNPDLSMLRPALDAQLQTELSSIRDDYGAYTSIPSQVNRLALKRQAENNAYKNRALALAEGNDANQRIKLAQLESLAGLTKKTKSSGFNTGLQGPGSGGQIASAGISAGGAIVAAAIM